MVLPEIVELPNFGRRQLASALPLMGITHAVEVGIAAGVYSEILMKANPQMRLWGIDPYVPYKGYRDYTRPQTFQKLHDEAHERLDHYSNYTFVEEFSEEALKQTDDETLDFVYIDGNHGDPWLTEDIEGWWQKLRSGGILAGHDYIRSKGTGGRPPVNDTKDATHRFAHANKLTLYILGTNAIIPGEVRDKVRSWAIKKT